MHTVNCLTCGAVLNAALPFCNECGTPVPRSVPIVAVAAPRDVACPSCAATVPASHRFCGGCGFAFAAVPSSGAALAVPAVPARPSPQIALAASPMVGPPPSVLGTAKMADPVYVPSPFFEGRHATIPAPAAADYALLRCTSCGAVLADMARACHVCGSNRVELAPGAGEVPVGPPPSSFGTRGARSSSLPSPPKGGMRPVLDNFQVPPPGAIPAEFTAVPPQPRGPSWTVTHLLNDGTTEVATVLHGEALFGRHTHAWLTDDALVSPRHMSLSPAGDHVLLRDLQSLNGIFLRLSANVPAVLTSGDVLLAGAQIMRFAVLDGEVPRPIVHVTNEVETTTFGSPARPRLAKLDEVTGDGQPGNTYVIGMQSVVIGREATDILYADDPHLSRRHAELRASAGVFTLTDLGSSNGTYIRIRGEVLLGPGDEIRIGQQRLRVACEVA